LALHYYCAYMFGFHPPGPSEFQNSHAHVQVTMGTARTCISDVLLQHCHQPTVLFAFLAKESYQEPANEHARPWTTDMELVDLRW
jgi:hypothetical protein